MDKRLERQLEEVLRQPGNDTCADCHAPAPRWASVNLGIFLCVGCASVHRKLGTHKSRVKSVTLDTWTREQIAQVKSIGNNAANAVWNPNETLHPPPTSTIHDERDSEIERYIRKKYELGAFRVRPSSSSSSGTGGGRMVEPTSLNRARERDGRLPAFTGAEAGLERENNKNPELNDIIARKEYTRDRDLPPLPPSGATASGGGGGPSAPPRPRPTRSPSNNNVSLNSTTSIWNTSNPTTTPASRSGSGVKEANLIDFSDTTANNATLPLQINMSMQNQAQNGNGASPASYGGNGMAGSWGVNNQPGPSSMSMSMSHGQYLSPQVQPGSWTNTQNGLSSSPSFQTPPFNQVQNMQNSFGASPQHQQQQQFGTAPSPNMGMNMNMGVFLSPQQTYHSLSPQSVYGQHLSPQPTFATGGQMSPHTQPSPIFNNQPQAFPQQQQQMYSGYAQNQSQPIMQGQGQGQGYAGTYGHQQWRG